MCSVLGSPHHYNLVLVTQDSLSREAVGNWRKWSLETEEKLEVRRKKSEERIKTGDESGAA